MGVGNRMQEIGSPRILVGIVTRNRAALLRRAINSTLRQKFTNFELAVFDDGSSDQTIELRGSFPNVLWIRRKVSSGCIPARSELMALENFDYFVSLDDDAWFLGDDEISVALQFLEQNNPAAAIAFDILSPDRLTPRPRITPDPAAMFIGCGHMLRLSAVRKVGGYIGSPGNYGGEEKDLCLRLMDAGYKIVRLPGVHVWHEKTALARDLRAQHASGVCNDLAMTFRRTSAGFLPLALGLKLYRHLQFAILNRLIGPSLRGIALFVKSIPVLVPTRKPVKTSTIRAFIALSKS